MKTRQKATAPATAPARKPVLVAVEPPKKAKAKPIAKAKPAVEEKPKRGGKRPGAGRPAYLSPDQRKENSAYVSMTSAEKASFEERAAKAGLTLSFFLRQLIGLPVDQPE